MMSMVVSKRSWLRRVAVLAACLAALLAVAGCTSPAPQPSSSITLAAWDHQEAKFGSAATFTSGDKLSIDVPSRYQLSTTGAYSTPPSSAGTTPMLMRFTFTNSTDSAVFVRPEISVTSKGQVAPPVLDSGLIESMGEMPTIPARGSYTWRYAFAVLDPTDIETVVTIGVHGSATPAKIVLYEEATFTF